MGYKDSFVDEYPYLVYSDDPEAVGGAGGGDIGVDPEAPMTQIENKVEETSTCFIFTDEHASKIIGNFPIGGNESMAAAGNVYLGMFANERVLYTGPVGTELQPAPIVGTTGSGTDTVNIYSIEDANRKYEIRAAG